MIAAVFVLLVLQTTPPRDTPAIARGTAVITGVVVSDDAEARPVRKASVTCSSPDAPEQTIMTDDRGRFAFAELPAGRYTLAASKPAWIRVAYGAKRPGRPGVAIAVARDQRTTAVIRMPRGSVVTGILLDHTNQPAAATPVLAFRSSMMYGERRLAPAGVSTTDDRGVYRIYGLDAGDYIVGAAARALAGATPATELRLTSDADVRHAVSPDARTPPPPPRSVALATTFFPGTPMSSQASVLSLRAGEERDGVDFALQLVPTARVEGVVSLPDGGAAPEAQVELGATRQTSLPGVVGVDGPRVVRTPGDGTFAFAGVAPGQYTLLAHASRPPQFLWASTLIVVDGETVSGVSLALGPGATIAGRVRFNGSTIAPPADLTTTRVTAVPAGANMTSARVVTPGRDGRFVMSDLMPGLYRLTASFPGAGRPGGWALKSATALGQDAIDGPVSIAPGQQIADATITFADRMAQIAGSVTTVGNVPATDYTVILFPADQPLRVPQSRRIQAVRPSADGAYAIRGLPSGAYLIAVVDDVEPGEWFDPAFLQRLAPVAGRITVADGEQKLQDLRIGGR